MPKCQSDNTQRLQVVYGGGMQNISTSSSSVIVGGCGQRHGRRYNRIGRRPVLTATSLLAHVTIPEMRRSE